MRRVKRCKHDTEMSSSLNIKWPSTHQLLELTCASIWKRSIVEPVRHSCSKWLMCWHFRALIFETHTYHSLQRSWGCWLPGMSLHLHSHELHWFPSKGDKERENRNVTHSVKSLERLTYCPQNKRLIQSKHENVQRLYKKDNFPYSGDFMFLFNMHLCWYPLHIFSFLKISLLLENENLKKHKTWTNINS